MRYLLLLTLILAPPLAALPIIVNGSFELPALSATQTLSGPFTLTGWTGTAASQGGNAGLVVGPNNGLTPFDGSQHFTFNGGNPSDQGWLEQTLATTPGTAYDLTFALGRAGGGQSLSLLVSIADTSQSFLPPLTTTYLLHTLAFTAWGPSTTLRFTDTSGPNSISDLYLDAVNVTPAATVHDPGPSLAILTLGALLLAIINRKS